MDEAMESKRRLQLRKLGDRVEDVRYDVKGRFKIKKT